MELIFHCLPLIVQQEYIECIVTYDMLIIRVCLHVIPYGRKTWAEGVSSIGWFDVVIVVRHASMDVNVVG